jgi:uncharacterized protein (TIGR02246 family)
MKTNRMGILAVAGVLVLAAGCSQTPAPPPPDNRAADEQAVKDMEAAWAKAGEAKDADAFTGFYADDAVVMVSGAPPMSGKENIRGGLKALFADPNYALTFQPTKVTASKGGDMVYSVGTYRETVTNPKTKKPETGTGSYMTVYRKQPDGSWKAVADMLTVDKT